MIYKILSGRPIFLSWNWVLGLKFLKILPCFLSKNKKILPCSAKKKKVLKDKALSLKYKNR